MRSLRIIVSELLLVLILASLTISESPKRPDNTIRISWCSDVKYYNGTTFGTNLNTLLSSLSANAGHSSTNGYYTMNSTALGKSDPDIIYGLLICRGDTSPNECKSCVSTATSSLPNKCPSAKSAVVWFDKCMVRYSDEPFLGIVNETANYPMRNGEKLPVGTDVKQFWNMAGNTLKDLASTLTISTSKPSQGDRKYYLAKSVVFNGYITLYATAQCTLDLTPIYCASCLEIGISELGQYCNDSKGCRMFNPSCNTRYELYQFYNNVSSASPLPPPAQLMPPPQMMPPPKGKSKTSRSLVVNIFVGILVFNLIVLVTVLIYLQRKKKRMSNDNESIRSYSRRSQGQNFENAGEDFIIALQYDFATLKYATNHFSDINKLGEGGFGIVYKGTLPNGQEVAIKRLSKGSHQGVEQFKNEALVVAKLQHRNLVRLLGFCLAPDEMLLIYEFVPNKSLDLILFDPETQGQLDWAARYQIIHGIARGMLYLHEDSRVKIVHRDLKASNVLLDVDKNPKISDFGLARNFAVNQKQDQTNRLAGTLGYMAPEYMEYGEISTKSDVYSFGVLVIEIITGKKISDRLSLLRENLLTYVWRHWSEGTPYESVDNSLGDSYSRTEVIRCLHLGLLCVQGNIEERPSMLSIVFYLNSTFDLPIPQQPAFGISTQKGSSSGTRELVSDKSTKSGSSSRTTGQQYDKSTTRSIHSFSEIEASTN